MADVVLADQHDGVLVISLNRPEKHNAFDDAMSEALDDVTANAVVAPDVRVIVLRGEGGSFSSGRDTTVLGRHGDRDHLRFVRDAQAVNRRLVDCGKPVIAALKGHVLGKGLELALAADIRIVARGASLGFPEIRFGLVTDNGGTAQATLLAGAGRAKYLLMTAEAIDADQAVSWGLAEILVDLEDLDDCVLGLAETLARRSPTAVALAKDIVNAHVEAAVRSGMRTELLAEAALFSSADYAEARAALRESRPPCFGS